MIVTEAEMIQRIKDVLAKRQIRVPNPDYRATGCFSPQWKIRGATYYYQLPKKGHVIATMVVTYHGKAIDDVMYVDGDTPTSKDCQFNEDGFFLLELV